MLSGRFKSLLVAGFSVLWLFVFTPAAAQEDSTHKEGKKTFDAKEIIFGHVLNNHDFHILDIVGDNGEKRPISIPLPVILYSKQRGLDAFMSSRFHHGEENYRNYIMLTDEKIKGLKLDPTKYNAQDIVALNDQGGIDSSVRIYDISLSKNVVQMFISMGLFLWVMLVIAKKYSSGQGVVSAPRGSQSLLEPVITFVRDEVAKPNLGSSYEKYLPFLLTIFFFILINNIIGLIPGSANVSGNIAFTAVLGIISFVVILFSSNKHYWGHIINPPVPFLIKVIMVPIEIMGLFTKPFALIIRLFANMISGHIIILSFIILIFIFGAMNTALGWGTSPFFVVLAVFIYLIEILVAFIQAFIFANLTAVFIGQAFEGGHDDHKDHGDGHNDAVVI